MTRRMDTGDSSLGKLVNKSGVECGVCRWGDVKPRLQRPDGIFSRDSGLAGSLLVNQTVPEFEPITWPSTYTSGSSQAEFER